MSRRLLSTAAVLLLASGCTRTEQRVLLPPEAAARLDRGSPYLKGHLRDGGLFILSPWYVDDAGAEVSGKGQEFDAARTLLREGALRFPIDKVALFETNVPGAATGSIGAVAVITAISVGLSVFCLSHTKSCFGSCPTFYAHDGSGERLVAEAFSGAVAPSLEETDVDALPAARPGGRDYALRMTNEAAETHVVRSVRLLAARRPEGGRVFATPQGRLLAAGQAIAPSACAAPEGDCLPALRALDGVERSSLSDPDDLAAKEELELRFDRAPAGRRGLVIGLRQSFVSTYLFYQSLAWMGGQASDFLALLGRSDRARGAAGSVHAALGGVEVLAERDGGWESAGAADEIGPIATDVQLVELPAGEAGPLRVKLRLARGSWRIDHAALAPIAGDAALERLEPVAAEPRNVARPAPGAPWVNPPGGEVTFRFRLPEEPERHELFLEARGYYIEWMRQEWLREEDPAQALALFRDPAAALRRLAPEFKKLEPSFERLFWESRHVGP